MPIAKFPIGSEVYVIGGSPYVGQVLSTRLRMEDETFQYIVRAKDDHDKVQTRPEYELRNLNEMRNEPEGLE